MTAAGKNRDKLSEFRKYISRRVSLTDALDEFISGDLSQKIGDTGLMGRTVPVNEAEVLRNSMSQNRQRYTQTSLKLPEHLPESLILELTTRCNYACPYCYCLWHEYPHLGRYVLRTDQWKRVIRYAVERHVADFQFSGGEALLHPGAAELLRFTRELLPEDLTLSREEWTELKAEIRKQDYGIPYTFCDELICECRDQPPEYLARFGNPNITPCQAGKVFGVIGPDGSFRKCLHCI